MAKKELGIVDPSISDKEYWGKFIQTKGDLEGGMNHDISLDVLIKFKGINGEIYETKEKDVSCNPAGLDIFFSNLKRTIRMLDETTSDRSPM